MNSLHWVREFSEIWQPVSARLALTIMHCFWQGALVALVLATLLRGLRNAAAGKRYVVAGGALLSLPVLAVFTFLTIQIPTTEHVIQTRAADEMSPSSKSPSASADVMATAAANRPLEMTESVAVRDQDVAAGANVGPTISPVSATANPQLAIQPSERLLRLRDYSPLVTVLYGAGVAVMLLRTLLSLWRGVRVRHESTLCQDKHILGLVARLSTSLGLRVAPAVAICERLAVPAVAGLIKPMILLPPALITSLSPDELSSILTHELAHIRRHDIVVNFLQRIIESLLFFHPATWWISRQISTERENCCDDLAVTTESDSLRYAAALLRMAELCVPCRGQQLAEQVAALSAQGHEPNQLTRRIERLLGMQSTPQLTGSRLLSAAVVLAFLFSIGTVGVWAQLQRDSEPPPRKSQGREPGKPRRGREEPAEIAAPKEDEAASLTEEVKRSIQWGDAVDGIRLGVCAAETVQRGSSLRHGDVLDYNVWIRNESDKTIHIPRSPLRMKMLKLDGDKINLTGSGLIMSFAVPTEAFEKATLTVAPQEVKNFILHRSVSALISPPGAVARPNSMKPLRLAPGKFEVFAKDQIHYHTAAEPNAKRPEYKSVSLQSGVTTLQVLPAARLQFRKVNELSAQGWTREHVAEDPTVNLRRWAPPQGEPRDVIISDSEPVLLDQDDILAIHGLNRADTAHASLRVTLTPTAATRIAQATIWMSQPREPRVSLGVFLDDKLISVRTLSQPISGRFPLIPTSFGAGGADRFARYMSATMFHCPCQTAWSKELDGLKVGARLTPEVGSRRVSIEYVLRNGTGKPLTISTGGRRGTKSIKPGQLLEYANQSVQLGPEFQPGRYLVAPALVKNDDGSYYVRSKITMERNNALIAQMDVELPRNIRRVSEQGDSETEETNADAPAKAKRTDHNDADNGYPYYTPRGPRDFFAPDEQADTTKRAKELATKIHAHYGSIPSLRIAVEVEPTVATKEKHVRQEIRASIWVPASHVVDTWRQENAAAVKRGDAPTQTQLRSMQSQLRRDIAKQIKQLVPPAADGIELTPAVVVIFFTPVDQVSKSIEFADHLNVRDLVIDRHNKTITSVATERDVSIRRWDVATGLLKKEVKLETELHGNFFLTSRMKLTADAKRLITIVKGEIHVWDTATGKKLGTLAKPEDGVSLGQRVLATTLDAHVVAAATQLGFSGFSSKYDCDILIWETEKNQLLGRVTHPDAIQITSLAFSADGRWLASGSQSATTCIFDAETGKLLHKLKNVNGDQKHPDAKVSPDGVNQVVCLEFSPDGKTLVMGDMLGVKILDVKSGRVRHRIESPFRFGYSGLTFSSDGRFVARVASDKTVPIWSTETGKLVAKLPTEAHAGKFSQDGRLFAAGFTDRVNALTTWQLPSQFATQKPVATPSKGLGFLAPYPELYGLSLGMTKQEFRTLAARKRLKFREAPNKESFSISVDDGHVVIVMFGGASDRCNGIQRLHGQ